MKFKTIATYYMTYIISTYFHEIADLINNLKRYLFNIIEKLLGSLKITTQP